MYRLTRCVSCLIVIYWCLPPPACAADEKPLATITPDLGSEVRLRNLLDEIRQDRNATGDAVIEFEDGTIYLDDTLVLDERLSRDNGRALVFRAAPGAKPVLSRGRAVLNWERGENGRWRAATGGRDIRQFFVNNVRAQRARGPFPDGAVRFGDLRVIDGDAGYIVPDEGPSKLRGDIVLGFFKSWSHMMCAGRITEETGGRVRIHMSQPTFTLISRKEGVRAEMPAYIENALELLDEPGEWYADNSTIYYLPRLGEDMATAAAIGTGRGELLTIAPGHGGSPARGFRFEGITFADAAVDDLDNHADVQANFTIEAQNCIERDGALVNLHNEYVKPRAAVTIQGGHDIAFTDCTFTRIGGAAVNIDSADGRAPHDIAFRRCAFFDIGGSAIQIGGVGRFDHHPATDAPESAVRNIRVEHCAIHDIGVEFEDSVGVFAGYVQNTVIEGNEIYNLPYSGISIGWGWGEEDAGGGSYPLPFVYQAPTPARDNRIANNHIHDVMRKRQDGGGIYTLGNQPGTVIEANRIHDNNGMPGGIYLDEGSGFIEVRGNRVYNVDTPMNFNNRNQNRIDTCNVHDNEFAKRAPAN